MDIKRKRRVTGAQGSAGTDQNPEWSDRATSWSCGAQTDYMAIEKEGEENDLRFGTPRSNALPDPAASNNDADAALPNPHNFSSNPGFMPAGRSLHGNNSAGWGGESGGGRVSGSTGLDAGKPNPTVGRTAALGHGSIAMPDQQSTDPGSNSDVAPQIVTTGFGG